MKPAARRLRQIVDANAARMRVEVRHTWELEGLTANAYALILTRELIFTERLLEVCTDEELAAICAHELAHLDETKKVRAGRLLGTLRFFPLIFVKPAIHNFQVAGIFILYMCFWLVSLFSQRLSRQMEKRADQLAKKEQSDEGVYARALEKLYQANQYPAVTASNRQTHPHLYDRLLAAGITPDYPRPAKPEKMTWPGVLLLLSLILILVRSAFLWINS